MNSVAVVEVFNYFLTTVICVFSDLYATAFFLLYGETWNSVYLLNCHLLNRDQKLGSG